MKITILCGYEKNKYTGVGKYVHDLGEQLRSADTEVEIEYERFHNSKFRQIAERFFALPIRTWRTSKQFSVTILPDEFYVFLLPFIRSSNSTVIIHDVRPIALSGGKYAWMRELFTNFQNKLFLRFADSVIVPSYFTRSCLGRGTVIPNMFDILDTADNESFIISHNLRKKKYLLFVGSSQFRKNFSTAEKVALMAKEKYDLDFICVGSINSSVGKTFQKISNTDLQTLYKHAFALINPSLFEGFGRVVIEAQIMSCPVLSTSCSALAEVLGESALFVSDPMDPSQYLSKIELLLDSKVRDHFIKTGLQNAARFKKDPTLLVEYRSELFSKTSEIR